MWRNNMKERISLAKPQMLGNERKYMLEAFDSNWIAPLGPFVNRLEDEMKVYLETDKYAVALSSGSAALHMAYKVAKIGKGDIVFCQSLTFAATCNPLVYEGATIVFIDSEKETFNMDPEVLEKAFEKYPAKAVVVADLYGNMAKYDEIEEICKKHNAILITDAAESLGSELNGVKAGNFGEFSAVSFNGNKIITTSGGGMLFTTTEEQKQKVIFYATQAKEPVRHYQHEEIGYNYRLSNICAAIGVGQLEIINQKLEKKRRIHQRYVDGLKDVNGIHVYTAPNNQNPNYWLSVAFFDDKENVLKVLEHLELENIEGRPIWKPMHMQPVYKDYEYISLDGQDVARELFESGICLPSDPNMTDEQQTRVIEEIKKGLN